MYQNEKTISEKEIYKGRVVHLTCDEVELENGYKTLREVIHSRRPAFRKRDTG